MARFRTVFWQDFPYVLIAYAVLHVAAVAVALYSARQAFLDFRYLPLFAGAFVLNAFFLTAIVTLLHLLVRRLKSPSPRYTRNSGG